MRRFLKLQELGIYNYSAGDMSSATTDQCDEISQEDCDYAWIGENLGAYGQSINCILYDVQIFIAGRFQEFQSLDKWVAGEIYTEPIHLSNIDRVPVSMVHPIADELCDPIMMEYTYAQIQSEDKHMILEKGGHLLFGFGSTPDFVQRMVDTIETGTVAGGLSTYITAVSASLLTLSLMALF